MVACSFDTYQQGNGVKSPTHVSKLLNSLYVYPVFSVPALVRLLRKLATQS